jgi:hypothetical protein
MLRFVDKNIHLLIPFLSMFYRYNLVCGRALKQIIIVICGSVQNFFFLAWLIRPGIITKTHPRS